jgi:hypothetical protein
MQRRSGHQPQVRNYFPRAKFYLSDQAETPPSISYFTPEPEVKEIIKKIEEKMWMKERIEKVKKILEEMDAKDNFLKVPFHAHDNSTMLVLLKAAGEIRILDASQGHEPD